jgi:hypothetical protein
MFSTTNPDKQGAVELHPPSPKSPNLQDVLDRGQESEEEVAGEGTLGVEEDAVLANIARQIEGIISKYTTSTALPFYDNANVFADPLLWWKQISFSSQSFHALHQKHLCIPTTEAPSERIFTTADLAELVEWFSLRSTTNGVKNSSRRR